MLTVLVILNLYLALNIGRLIKRRIHMAHLRRVFWRTTIWLLGLQAAIIVGTLLTQEIHAGLLTWFYILVAIQLAGSLIMLVSY